MLKQQGGDDGSEAAQMGSDGASPPRDSDLEERERALERTGRYRSSLSFFYLFFLAHVMSHSSIFTCKTGFQF